MVNIVVCLISTTGSTESERGSAEKEADKREENKLRGNEGMLIINETAPIWQRVRQREGGVCVSVCVFVCVCMCVSERLREHSERIKMFPETRWLWTLGRLLEIRLTWNQAPAFPICESCERAVMASLSASHSAWARTLHSVQRLPASTSPQLAAPGTGRGCAPVW